MEHDNTMKVVVSHPDRFDLFYFFCVCVCRLNFSIATRIGTWGARWYVAVSVAVMTTVAAVARLFFIEAYFRTPFTITALALFTKYTNFCLFIFSIGQREEGVKVPQHMQIEMRRDRMCLPLPTRFNPYQGLKLMIGKWKSFRVLFSFLSVLTLLRLHSSWSFLGFVAKLVVQQSGQSFGANEIFCNKFRAEYFTLNSQRQALSFFFSICCCCCCCC